MGTIRDIREAFAAFPPPPTPEERRRAPCPQAKAFAEWCETLLRELRQHQSQASVDRAHLALTHKGWDWYREVAVPSHLRQYRSTHRCILEEWQEAYLAIRAIELRLPPPPLTDPPPVPPPRIAQPQVYLGDIEEEDEEI